MEILTYVQNKIERAFHNLNSSNVKYMATFLVSKWNRIELTLKFYFVGIGLYQTFHQAI